MSRYRRRKKRSVPKTLFLWGVGLSLVGWGLYQAAEFRQKLAADYARSQALAAEEEAITTRPAVAVDGVTVTRRDLGTRSPSGDYRMTRLAAGPTAVPPLTERGEDPTLEILDPLNFDPPRRAARTIPHFVQPPLFEATLTPDELIARATTSLDSGRIAEGRAALNAALSRAIDDTQAQMLRDMLADLNIGVFLGSEVLPEDPLACYIDIEAGDSFLRLGRDFGLPSAYFELINPSLNPRNLKPLTGVKVVQGPFSLRLTKKAARLDLYLGELYIRSYHVSLPEGNFLPAGDYRIASSSKIQVANRLWIGFSGAEPVTESVEAGWIFGSWGPRGTSTRNRATGMILADADVAQLYNVLVEFRSHLQVEP